MKKIVVDMQNFLFADSIATAFKNSDYDIAVVRAESPRDTIELCRVFKPFVLLMEVTAYTPFADAGDDEAVSIPKAKYELMIDDLLTMSEIIQCVADMRTQDVKAIREFGKFVPAFAAFEKNRLSLYREAAKEAEEIFDRWADEIDDLDEDFTEDEDYEPDEYYSD